MTDFLQALLTTVVPKVPDFWHYPQGSKLCINVAGSDG